MRVISFPVSAGLPQTWRNVLVSTNRLFVVQLFPKGRSMNTFQTYSQDGWSEIVMLFLAMVMMGFRYVCLSVFWQSVLLTVWLTNPRGPETADPMNIWDTTYAEQHIVYFSWCLRPTSLLDWIYAHIWPHTISWHPDYKFCVVLQLRKLLISRNITLLSVLEPTSLTPSINCEPFLRIVHFPRCKTELHFALWWGISVLILKTIHVAFMCFGFRDRYITSATENRNERVNKSKGVNGKSCNIDFRPN